MVHFVFKHIAVGLGTYLNNKLHSAYTYLLYKYSMFPFYDKSGDSIVLIAVRKHCGTLNVLAVTSLIIYSCAIYMFKNQSRFKI